MAKAPASLAADVEALNTIITWLSRRDGDNCTDNTLSPAALPRHWLEDTHSAAATSSSSTSTGSTSSSSGSSSSASSSPSPTAAEPPVDAILLLGGIPHPCFAEPVAAAMRRGLARWLILVGGAGHSTDRLRAAVAAHPVYGATPVAGRTEADILYDVMTVHLGVSPAAVLCRETRSSNCGNNASLALVAVREAVAGAAAVAAAMPRRILLVQDPLMMRRSCESFLKEWAGDGAGGGVEFACWAPAIPLLQPLPATATLTAAADADRGDATALVTFVDPQHCGVWPLAAFLDLAMGEVPRLRPAGYGPLGSGFIGHVHVPPPVDAAYDALLPRWGAHVRAANAAFATAAAPSAVTESS